MSLETPRDTFVEAALALAHTSTNLRLRTLVGDDPIRQGYKSPFPAGDTAEAKLPSLSIWRAQDREEALSEYDYLERTTLRIDYICRHTPLDKLDDRWGLLRKVWDNVYKTLKIGYDPLVKNGLKVLEQAGVNQYIYGSASVRYLFPRGEDNPFPGFQGQMDFLVQSDAPAAQTQALGDFLRMYVDFNDIATSIDPDTNDENQTLVESIIGTPSP